MRYGQIEGLIEALQKRNFEIVKTFRTSRPPREIGDLRYSERVELTPKKEGEKDNG